MSASTLYEPLNAVDVSAPTWIVHEGRDRQSDEGCPDRGTVAPRPHQVDEQHGGRRQDGGDERRDRHEVGECHYAPPPCATTAVSRRRPSATETVRATTTSTITASPMTTTIGSTGIA